MNDLKFLHALNLVYAVGPATLICLRETFGSYESAWHKTEEELRRAGINEKIIKEIIIKKYRQITIRVIIFYINLFSVVFICGFLTVLCGPFNIINKT